MHLITSFLLATFALASTVKADRIAVMYPIGSKSHFFGLKPAIELLAERGHNVTVFTPFQGITRNIKNVREIYLEDIEKIINAEMHIDWFSIQNMGKFQYFQMMCHMTSTMARSAEAMLKNREFRQLIAERDVDLFVVDAYSNEFVYPIADLIKVPLVTHLSGSPLPMLVSAFGGPVEYASVPSPFTHFDDNMDFYERLQNVLISELVHFMRKHLMFKKLDTVVRNEFPSAITIDEAEKKVSLMIVNSHVVTTFPRSLPPTVIPIGALHTRPAKDLPKDLRNFVDDAEHGFIVFSLGSFIPMYTMPNETFRIFSNVFSQLPQKVVWKWETRIPSGVPSNVYMADWIPQQDLFGHRNARLFITHGGLLGTQEAIYHGLPLLSLPFGNDQKGNVVRAKRDGYAIQLEWGRLDEDILLNAIQQLIHSPRARQQAAKASQLVRDEVVPGKELAVYWIEYVLRHDGTAHLGLAAKNLPFYKIYLLDVATFLLTVCAACVYFTYRFVCFVTRTCSSSVLGQRKKLKTT